MLDVVVAADDTGVASSSRCSSGSRRSASKLGNVDAFRIPCKTSCVMLFNVRQFSFRVRVPKISNQSPVVSTLLPEVKRTHR